MSDFKTNLSNLLDELLLARGLQKSATSDPEYEALIVKVDQENELLFGADLSDRMADQRHLPPDVQISNAVDAAEIRDLLQLYAPESITVLEKYHVSPSVYQETADRLEFIADCLVDGQEYYPEELIGIGLWAPLPPASERQFELCLMHFAAMENHPLQDTNCGSFLWQVHKGRVSRTGAAHRFSRACIGGVL